MAHPIFNSTFDELETIRDIVTRAQKLLLTTDRLSSIMDIDACNSNGTPLDLNLFLAFDDSDFIHDFTGITSNINRLSGKMENCFLPRCVK